MLFTREKLGSGYHFKVYSWGPNEVFKVTRYPFCSESNWFGREAKERLVHDISLLDKYIGADFVLPSKISTLPGENKWVVQQERLDVFNRVNRLTLNDSQRGLADLQTIANGAFRMFTDSGFFLDWFGLNFFASDGAKMLTDPDYWALPNLVIYKNRVRICDIGLLWGNASRKPDTLVVPLELTVWPVYKKLLKIVEKRSGIKFF